MIQTKTRCLAGTLLAAGLTLVFPFSAHAADYSFHTAAPADYYGSTSYEDVYDVPYVFGGPNVTDFKVPDLIYGSTSNTQTGAMERTILPGLQAANAAGSSGGYGISGSGGSAAVAEGPVTSIVPQTPSASVPQIQQPAYTSVEGMKRSDGSIGTVKIPSLGLNRKVWEGETTSSMSKGLGHYSSTSAWNGNVGVCGHNRGSKYVIGSIKDLKIGDKITYETVYGTRTYRVSFVKTIANNDWTYLQGTADNRITLTTCLADHPEVRICVQATEDKS